RGRVRWKRLGNAPATGVWTARRRSRREALGSLAGKLALRGECRNSQREASAARGEVIVSRAVCLSVLVLAAISLTPLSAQRVAISNKAETPFKLATFEAQGKVRVGLTSGSRLLDAAEASAFLTQKAGLPAVSVPREIR